MSSAYAEIARCIVRGAPGAVIDIIHALACDDGAECVYFAHALESAIDDAPANEQTAPLKRWRDTNKL